MNNNLNEMVKKYIETLIEIDNYAYIIIEKIAKICKPVIKDIKCSVGWEEGGIDTLCFYSNSHHKQRAVCFEDLITEVIPTLKGHVYCPFGFYLSKKEAQKIRELLIKEMNKNERDKI